MLLDARSVERMTLVGRSSHAANAASAPASAKAEAKAQPEAEFSFWDLLDVVNPLQHIPVVGTLYRQATGDTISAPASIVGGGLFGGPVGAMAAVANAIVEDATGKDIGEQAVAFFMDDKLDASTTMVASAVHEPAPLQKVQLAQALPETEPVKSQEPVTQTEKPAAVSKEDAKTWPPGGPAPLPPELVADAMMQALEKYKAASQTKPPAPR